jgi:hypothetical protein
LYSHFLIVELQEHILENNPLMGISFANILSQKDNVLKKGNSHITLLLKILQWLSILFSIKIQTPQLATL